MVFTKTGIVNSEKSILYVDKLIEEFFDIYSFDYGNQRVTVTGKRENGLVHAKINVEGVGMVPVCIKKGKPGLLLAEKLAKQYSNSLNNKKVITESVIEKRPQPVVLVEQQKQEIIGHIDDELSKYKERLDFFTENANKFIETKVKEHGSSLLKEYLKTVDQLKPTFESIITEGFRKHIQNVDSYVKNKTESLNHQIAEYSHLNEEFKSELFEKFEEVKAQHEKLIAETIDAFDAKITESNSSYEQLKTKLTEYIVAAKDGAEELTNKALNTLQEKIDSNLELSKKESSNIVLEESKTALKKIEGEILSVNEKYRDELEKANAVNFTNSFSQIKNLLKEENKKLMEFHSTQFSELTEFNKKCEASSKESLNELSNFVLQEQTKLTNLYKQQINEFSNVVRECKNEFRKMMTTLKEDITKSVLNSVNTELLEEKNGNKTAMLMNEIRSIKSRLDAQYIQLRREIADVGGGGGGTVAVQYANGGEMKGTLNVTEGDYLSAGHNLNDMYFRLDQAQQITEQQAQNFMQTLQSGDLNLDSRGSTLSVLCAAPAATWIINHNFGYLPNIRIINTNGDEIDGSVTHNEGYTALTATFSWNSGPTPIAGIAYLD